MKKFEIDLLKFTGGLLLIANACLHPTLLNIAFVLLFTVSFRLILVKR